MQQLRALTTAFHFVCAMLLSLVLLAACKKEEPAELPRAKRAERPSRSFQETQKVPEYYEVGGDVSAPTPVYQVDAHYPDDGVEHEVGSITVRATVKTDGSVSNAELLSGPDNSFTRAEVAAVRQWVFDPAKRNGKAVPVRVLLTVEGVPLTPDGGF